MATTIRSDAAEAATVARVADGHPPGLYVLFATEMWERFSFYSMLAMFTLYLRDTSGQGFGWSVDGATGLYSNYLMFVYASPLVGGWLADRKLGYRRAVMLGGLFFMAGHLLLSFRSVPVVYAALACLVVGNGLFKPNVSTMVGNLYPEGSHLKDRAYTIFYMGINVGAFLAPVVAEFVQGRFGYHPAFAVAAGGMAISVWIQWQFRRHLAGVDRMRAGEVGQATDAERAADAGQLADAAAVAVDAPPHGVSRQSTLEAVPEWKRVGALLVVFAIVIIFWMAFQQNGSTMTYWGNENTDWRVSGIISNAIGPAWVLLLTFPLVWFWKWLDGKGLEPSTPTKMAFGMMLTSIAFLVLFFGARVGEASVKGAGAYDYKVSPAWLVGAYGVLTIGELMLSPMGLALVSKVAPRRMRGLLMGGWFVATAVGNKLTQVGELWDDWLHSTFWLFLSACALVMAFVLLALLRPLKKAMPGV
jgi:POT family proton-dependent oligopeptide transporter